MCGDDISTYVQNPNQKQANRSHHVYKTGFLKLLYKDFEVVLGARKVGEPYTIRVSKTNTLHVGSQNHRIWWEVEKKWSN